MLGRVATVAFCATVHVSSTALDIETEVLDLGSVGAFFAPTAPPKQTPTSNPS
jgi:hypothetical protein